MKERKKNESISLQEERAELQLLGLFSKISKNVSELFCNLLQ